MLLSQMSILLYLDSSEDVSIKFFFSMNYLNACLFFVVHSRQSIDICSGCMSLGFSQKGWCRAVLFQCGGMPMPFS